MIAPCEQLDTFFDGELPDAAAADFRDHLATCARCEAGLRGRMLEAVVVDDEAPPIMPAATVPMRRMRGAIVGISVALAATVALAWWAKGHSTPPPGELAIVLSIERGPAVTRGETARVGDIVHVRAHAPLWIYRGDHELVAACPGGESCSDDGASVTLRAVGTYSIVVVANDVSVPAPQGSLDADVSAAVRAGARYRIETLDVQ